MALTSSIRRLYKWQGYVIVDDVWSSQECELFIKASQGFAEYQRGDYMPVMQPHRIHPLFLQALREPRIVSAMEDILGGPVSGLQSTWFYGAPGPGAIQMHMDNDFVEAQPGTFGSAWSAMTDITPEMGALINGETMKPIVMKRGSILFMDGDFPHASGHNQTQDFRYALLLTYIRKGFPFRPGNTAKRSEVDVYA